MNLVITTHLWIWWARVAIEQEAVASDARAGGQALVVRDHEFTNAFAREGFASMVAVSASAHGLDALFGGLARVVAPVRTGSRWSTILETVKQAAFVRGPAVGGGIWAREFEWLFDARDAAVHFEEAPHPSVPHPSGTYSGHENALYCLESARRAVDLLLEVIETCVDAPRPQISTWADTMRPTLDELRRLRSRDGK